MQDIDENHEKLREHKERIEKSKKARGRRNLIREKNGRKHDSEYRGAI